MTLLLLSLFIITVRNEKLDMNTGYTAGWFNGSALLLHSDTANDFDLKNGYRIKSEKEFWDILSHNVSIGISKIEIQKLLVKQNDN